MEYILGIVVSLVVEGVKKKVKADSFTTHAVLFLLAIVGAGLFVWASSQDFWPVILKVLTAAAAFHNLVIRKLDKIEQ